MVEQEVKDGPFPEESANYSLHTISDNKLLQIMNFIENVKDKQPSNHKLVKFRSK